MVRLYGDGYWIQIETTYIVDWKKGLIVFCPNELDVDTRRLLHRTARQLCPVGILADRIEEEYPMFAELAELLRKGSGVGRSGKVLEADDGRPDQSQVRH
jgi:hypothetical protein